MPAKKSILIKENGAFLNNGLSVHYNAYCKRKKISKYEKVDKITLIKIAGNILKEIGNQLVEAKGGVFIKNFGYFFIWKTQAKGTYGEKYKHNKDGANYNYATNNYYYKPIFIPSGGPYNMRYWSMDNRFNLGLRKRIKEKLVSGYKYRMYVHSLRSLLKLG